MLEPLLLVPSVPVTALVVPVTLVVVVPVPAAPLVAVVTVPLLLIPHEPSSSSPLRHFVLLLVLLHVDLLPVNLVRLLLTLLDDSVLLERHEAETLQFSGFLVLGSLVGVDLPELLEVSLDDVVFGGGLDPSHEHLALSLLALLRLHLAAVDFMTLSRQNLFDRLLVLEQDEPEPSGFASLVVLHDGGVDDGSERTEILPQVGRFCS